jgi:hypothetical protein
MQKSEQKMKRGNQLQIYRQVLGFEPEPGTIHSNKLTVTTGGRHVYMIDRSHLYRIQLNNSNSNNNSNNDNTTTTTTTITKDWEHFSHHQEDYEEFMYTKNDPLWKHQSCCEIVYSLVNNNDPNHVAHFVHLEYDSVHDRCACVDQNGSIYLFYLSLVPDSKRRIGNNSSTRMKDSNWLLSPSYMYQSEKNVSGMNSGEFGWCKLVFDPQEQHVLYLARHWHRDVLILHQSNNTNELNVGHCLYCTQRPTDIDVIKKRRSSNRNEATTWLLVAQTNTIIIYHCKESDSEPVPISLIEKFRGTIYSMTHIQNSQTLLSVAGTDRNVYIYETEKWTPQIKWQNAIKYAPSWMHLVKFDDHSIMVCVAGMDNNELKCAFVNDADPNSKIKQGKSIYADSRWVGLSYYRHYAQWNGSNNVDMIVGVSESGTLYVILNPHLSIS